MKRILLFLALTSACLAQQVTLPVIYQNGSIVSVDGATATGAGNILKLGNGAIGVWTWTTVFTGSPTGTAMNLEGSIDVRIGTDGAATASSATFTSATGGFLATDVGKEIRIAGAGASGATLVTTISAVTNTTTVTLAATASTTVAGATYNVARWFTLDSSTTTTSEMRHVTYKPVGYIRCNLATLSGGSSPAAMCRIGLY